MRKSRRVGGYSLGLHASEPTAAQKHESLHIFLTSPQPAEAIYQINSEAKNECHWVNKIGKKY